MAYIDYNILYEFPFECEFYRMTIDESKPLDQQVEEKVVVHATKCDITEATHTASSTFISAKWSVYFPFDKANEEVVVRNGDMFTSNMYGIEVNGKVVGVFPSQLGGVTVYVQDLDV